MKFYSLRENHFSRLNKFFFRTIITKIVYYTETMQVMIYCLIQDIVKSIVTLHIDYSQ